MLSAEKIARWKRSKWTVSFVSMAILQVVISLVLLIPAFVNVKRIPSVPLNSDLSTDQYSDKAFKVSGECIMFIVYELWRLWLAIDGIMKLNSRTIYASACFTILSFLFSIMMVAESANWIRAVREIGNTSTEEDHLRVINQYLQIALAIVIFILTFPTIYIAHKVTKDLGWGVYKKIGSSLEIEAMYVHLQWLSLMLKVDLFFEFISYILLLLYQNYSNSIDSLKDAVNIIVCIALLLPSLLLCRISVSKESNAWMITFIVFQILFIANTIYIIVETFDTARSWYAYLMYSLGVIVAAITTIALSIRCQLNFNKGLKDFVQYHPWKKSASRNSGTQYSMRQSQSTHGLNGVREDVPIDD